VSKRLGETFPELGGGVDGEGHARCQLEPSLHLLQMAWANRHKGYLGVVDANLEILDVRKTLNDLLGKAR
jgi:hypothetical protein